MDIIKKLKKDTHEEALINAISVRDFSQIEIAKLVPIGNWVFDDRILLESFTKWRKVFMRFFLSQFEPSIDSTKNFLKNLPINQINRILFAIYVNGELMGHCGLSNVDNQSAEIDNIIRGKPGGPSDLMYFSEKSLLTWTFKVLAVKKVYGQIFSTNFLSLSLFKRFGFSLKEKLYLKKVFRNNMFSYETCTNKEATENFFLDIIEVKKNKFFESIDLSKNSFFNK